MHQVDVEVCESEGDARHDVEPGRGGAGHGTLERRAQRTMFWYAVCVRGWVRALACKREFSSHVRRRGWERRTRSIDKHKRGRSVIPARSGGGVHEREGGPLGCAVVRRTYCVDG